MKAIPYTLRSFIELAENENRRGKDISRLDPDVRRATRTLRERRERFLAEIKRLERDDPARDEVRTAYREDRLELRRERDQAVEAAMHDALSRFEEQLSNDKFTFGLREGPKVGPKATPTYRTDASLDIAYPAKQAADAVKRAARIDSSSRNSIIRALQETLDKKYLHAIYKVDVREFFESVPHRTLLQRLAAYPELDSVTSQLIRRLLHEYESIKGTDTGIPRGVGLSSHLAELYLSEFDSKLKTHPGVLFYARYVDDIVMVLESGTHLAEVKDLVASELGSLHLTLNRDKTFELITDDAGDYPPDKEIEYLGYRFFRADGRLTTGLTVKRKARRSVRLEQALNAWLSTSPSAVDPNDGHNGLLVDRVRYLAGNTKLLNSKSNVAIGLYFSNSALTPDAAELAELDGILQAFLENHASKMPDKMSERMAQVSFVEMFASQTFLRFRQKRIEQIMNVWKGQVR
ncbi:antiviral reverse transcriptase Drt3a [Microbacterium sp. YY-01]|uniref:antiviral reverse transcriptase Drt3a n=1 Tax=Microbacterium sp. YY-01 TaxID=3421634 RepID=UPI003D17605D